MLVFPSQNLEDTSKKVYIGPIGCRPSRTYLGYLHRSARSLAIQHSAFHSNMLLTLRVVDSVFIWVERNVGGRGNRCITSAMHQLLGCSGKHGGEE